MMAQAAYHESRVMSAVTVKRASPHPWGTDAWILAGVIPGMSPVQLQQHARQGELHIWPDLTVTLYSQHAEAYYQNLTSRQPLMYLLCHDDESPSLQPFLMTVDHDEAASYLESGTEVLTTALPETLCVWLEQFVIAHYLPQKMKKRQRVSWHDEVQR